MLLGPDSVLYHAPEGDPVEPAARYENLKIPLDEPCHGLTEVSAIMGIPEWWPTGARVAITFAHGAASGLDDPQLEALQRSLTEARYLTLRFNFPFWEGRKPGKRVTPDPMPVLESTFQTALAMLNRDPTAAPAHTFIGGKGLGAQVAAHLATTRLRVDGLFLLGLPLHRQDKPESLEADDLYRVIAPTLFLQGTRDRRCDLPTLRRTLLRLGAPVSLWIVDGADQNFKVLKKSDRSEEDVEREISGAVGGWLARELGEA